MIAAVVASSIPSLSWAEVLGRVALAAALGAVLGLERELREREAGLRTHLLVSVGSALFTIVSAYGFREFLVNGGAGVWAGPPRTPAPVLTRAGFLRPGAGTPHGPSVGGVVAAAARL